MTREDFLDPITAATWRSQVRKQEWEDEKREYQEWRRKEREKFRSMSYRERFKALLCFKLPDDDDVL